MIDDIFVFDNVIHAYDLSDNNLRDDNRDQAEHARELLLSRAREWREEIGLARRWSPDALHDMVFQDSPTDLAMAQVVPIYDWYKDWFAPVMAQYEMARRYPEKVLFCGGVDPNYRGLDDALTQMQYQVEELGAVSMKFYNGHVEESWRCDDASVAYPMYERAQELGLSVLQFHKGIPLGKQNMEHLSPLDLQKAARDFPDMNFIVHHLSLPYFDESVSIAARFPNVYLALSNTWSHYAVAPRMLEHRMGTLLRDVGARKLLWGSEAPLVGPPRPYLEAFMSFQISEELQAGYGYPDMTQDDRRAILGGNFARLMGIEIPGSGSEAEHVN